MSLWMPSAPLQRPAGRHDRNDETVEKHVTVLTMRLLKACNCFEANSLPPPGARLLRGGLNLVVSASKWVFECRGPQKRWLDSLRRKSDWHVHFFDGIDRLSLSVSDE
eukprot:2517593-Rhodomonas_salina.2